MSRKSQLSKPKKTNDPLNKEEVISVVRQEVVKSYSGPIPDADQIQKYDAVSPGFAKELLEMAKKDLDHRISMAQIQQQHDIAMDEKQVTMQSKFIVTQQRQFALGQIIGTLWVGGAITAGCYFAKLGNPGTGGTIIAGAFAVLVSVLLWGKWRQEGK